MDFSVKLSNSRRSGGKGLTPITKKIVFLPFFTISQYFDSKYTKKKKKKKKKTFLDYWITLCIRVRRFAPFPGHSGFVALSRC